MSTYSTQPSYLESSLPTCTTLSTIGVLLSCLQTAPQQRSNWGSLAEANRVDLGATECRPIERHGDLTNCPASVTALLGIFPALGRLPQLQAELLA